MSSIGCKSLATIALLFAASCGGGGGDSKASAPGAQAPVWHGPSPHAGEEESDDGAGGGDDMDVQGLHGQLDQADIDAGMAPHQGDLAQCYQGQVRSDRFLSGKVKLKVSVGPDGKVTQALVEESDLGAWPVEKCLLEIARGMSFKQPRGGDHTADFEVPLDFKSGRIQANWWEEERIEKEVTPKLPELDKCSEESPPPRNLFVTVYIGNKGQVKSVGFASPVAPVDAIWADCAVAAIQAWKMPDPLGHLAKSGFRYRAE